MKDENDRTPEEVDDAFEAIVDGRDQDPITFYVEVSPIAPEDDVEEWVQELRARVFTGPADG